MENNVHQPYEMWLYDSRELTTEQRAMLYQHLRECSRCRQIQQGWGEVMRQIGRARFAKPAEGFSQRWRISIDARRVMQMRRQTWRILLWLTAAAFISLSFLALQVSTGTPLGILLSQMKIIARLIADTFMLIRAITTFFQAFPTTITISLSFLFLCVFGYLTVIWVKTFIRITKDGVSSK